MDAVHHERANDIDVDRARDLVHHCLASVRCAVDRHAESATVARAVLPERALAGQPAPALRLPFQALAEGNHVAQWTEAIITLQ